MAELHTLVPIGVFGFLLNFASGIMFLTTVPDQYLYNPAFQTRIFFMLLAGRNMLIFYRKAMAEVKITDRQFKAPAKKIRFMGTVSLTCWIMVIIGGRLTYLIPPTLLLELVVSLIGGEDSRRRSPLSRLTVI